MDASGGGQRFGGKKMEESGGSHDKPGKKSSESLLSFMECPICLDVSLPIYQCGNGHIICQVCWESLVVKTCPTCRMDICEPNRNRVLEQIIQTFDTKLACKFAGNGCPEKMLFPLKDAHQATCQFKNYQCPLLTNGCTWAGRLTDIVSHLKGRKRPSHAVPVLYGESATFFFASDPDVDGQSHLAIQIHSCFDTFFLIAFRTIYNNSTEGEAEYSALVQHVGLENDTKNFAYRMELERDGRRLSWEAVPLSISEGIKSSMDRGDCLTFAFKSMLLFKNEDTDMIPIDVTIHKI